MLTPEKISTTKLAYWFFIVQILFKFNIRHWLLTSNAMKTTNQSKQLRSLLLIIMVMVGLSSCYSVRVVSRGGVAEPDYSNDSQDFYKNKKTHSIDTTINLKLSQGSFELIRNCGPTGFFALEYRVTLGQVLLSGITLGRVRKVKVTYVCLKEDN